jgi:SAM-dependent methyltransferase
VAKSQRSELPELPLSRAFYDALAQVGRRAGYRLDDRAALSQAVAALSALYTRERDGLAQGALGSSAPLARLGFFLPRDLVKMFGPLAELARAGRLPARPTLRVLDLGAGLGATSLGLARYLRHAGSPVQRLQVTAVERDETSLKLMSALCEATRALPSELVPIDLTLSRADLVQALPSASFDFVLLGFVLNELFLEQPPEQRPALRAELLAKLAGQLSPEGALIVLEPALKESARELMRSRDALLGAAEGIHIFAPCVHREPCPMLARERDWCHESLDYALPEHLAQVAKQAGLRFEGLSYAALLLTKQPRFDDVLPRQRIVSDRLVSKGKLELFGCSRAGYQRLTRLDRDQSALNAGFDHLRRGDIVELEGTRIGKNTVIKAR